MRTITEIPAETSLELLHKLTEYFVLKSPKLVDHRKSYALFSYGAVMTVKAPWADIDFTELDYTPARWTGFLNSYINPVRLQQWIHGVKSAKPSAEILFYFDTPVRHKNGGCLVSLSFHQSPFPQLTLVSRATQLIPIGALELSLCGLIAEWLYNELRLTEWPRLLWFSAQLQYRLDFSLPYLITSGIAEKLNLDFKSAGFTNGKTILNDLENGREFGYSRYRRLAQKIKKALEEEPLEPFYPREIRIGGVAQFVSAGEAE